MHLAFQAIIGVEVHGADGIVGTMRDLLFEQDTFQIRYLDIAAADLFSMRRILLAPESVQKADWPRGVVNVHLDQQQVQDSPRVEEHRSLPRQKELELVRHFGWSPYWATGPVGLTDAAGLPTPSVPVQLEREDANLWNAQELLHYRVRSTTADVGDVDDLIFDDQDWRLRDFVVNLENWTTGRRVLASVEQLQRLDVDERTMHLTMSKRELEAYPRFKPNQAVNHDGESRRFDYYGRQKDASRRS